MAKKVLQAVRPVNQMNKAQRKEKKKAPKRVQGVSEQYDDGSEGDLATKAVTIENFDEVVMDDTKDVILLLHAQGTYMSPINKAVSFCQRLQSNASFLFLKIPHNITCDLRQFHCLSHLH